MPKGMKICPTCGKSNGCRKKTCECSHVFGGKQERTTHEVKQTTHPLGQRYVPEPGLWVFDIGKGMPAIHVADAISSGKINNQEVYDQCTYNGLGECLYAHIPTRSIADPELRKLWKKAHDSMREVWRYMTHDHESSGSTAKA